MNKQELRDIEWLKEEIHKELESWYGVEGGIDGDGINEIMLLINQLDEPEVLSQEWVTEHEMPIYWMAKEQRVVRVEDLRNLIVPKWELPVIPKFVAEWIEELKQDVRPLYSVMSSLMNKTNHEWAVWESANKNFSEIVAQAWIDGYTIEKEPKYYAMVKGGELLSEEKYWNLWLGKGTLEIGDNTVHPDVADEYIFKATKEEWNELGINDTNADFEEVDAND